LSPFLPDIIFSSTNCMFSVGLQKLDPACPLSCRIERYALKMGVLCELMR
jgi:hypothetical protein